MSLFEKVAAPRQRITLGAKFEIYPNTSTAHAAAAQGHLSSALEINTDCIQQYLIGLLCIKICTIKYCVRVCTCSGPDPPKSGCTHLPRRLQNPGGGALAITPVYMYPSLAQVGGFWQDTNHRKQAIKSWDLSTLLHPVHLRFCLLIKAILSIRDGWPVFELGGVVWFYRNTGQF